MRLLLAAALALASASALGQDAPAAEETKAASLGTKVDIGFAMPAVLSLAKACAEETDKHACHTLQLIQAVAECALNGITVDACGQPTAEAE